ncbi:galactose-binding domain-like [Anaeramoeba flamelloides]|uniref:Galactose-binding domain-like n=1 Tax=Anaeramoeba flamelloides TaxID=1746091 RepID=A0ABQ8YBW2_9EUKA|nr:galactose-binding domain-like [Anaeramoeba flamelloides]
MSKTNFNQKQSKKLFKKLEKISSSVIILKSDFSILFANKLSVQLFGANKSNLKNYKIFDLSPDFQKHFNLETKVHVTNAFEPIKSGKKISVYYSCLQKTLDKLEFWSSVYVTLIRINFEPCFQCIFKKTDGPSEENSSEPSLKLDLGTITTETETDYLEDECYEDKFHFEVEAIKKLIAQVDKKEFSETFLPHLEKVIKIYTGLVEKKNAKIENFNDKLKTERKKYKSKYEGLQSHLQRRMDGLENNKNDKTKLMKKSLSLKSSVNKYTQLMRKHQIYIDKLNKLVEDSDGDSGSDSDSDEI